MKASKVDVRKFMSKNVVAIIMIPALFGVHYMWYRLQNMDELVRPDERERLKLEQSMISRLYNLPIERDSIQLGAPLTVGVNGENAHQSFCYHISIIAEMKIPATLYNKVSSIVKRE